MGGILSFFSVLIFSSFVFANSNSSQCRDLIHDLQAMQSAQKELMRSFSQKNEMMAVVLEQNADKFEKSLTSRRALKRSDFSSLRVSARAFRGHEQRESALIERFQKASEQLMEQVQSCLSQSGPIVKN